MDARFEGIALHHEGMAVSDYVNMIPLGDKCLDRLGDEYVREQFGNDDYRGHFVDSKDNLYVVVGDGLYRTAIAADGSPGEFVRMQGWSDKLKKMVDVVLQGGPVSFCESGIKPSIVYLCDGLYIYCWSADGVDIAHRGPFEVNGVIPVDTDVRSFGQPCFLDYFMNTDTTFMAGQPKNFVSRVCWFDNKLVAVQKAKNTVWISSTDPGQWYRDSALSYTTSQTAAPTGVKDRGYDFWANWYSSTADSSNLKDVVAFRGELYFFNDNSIEIWSRTGNEQNPIQSNTSQMIHFGAEFPTIIGDRLYFVGYDYDRTRFIGCIGGEQMRISTREIERRLGSVLGLFSVTQYEESHLRILMDGGKSLMFNGKYWWTWCEPSGEQDPVVETYRVNHALTASGNIVRFSRESRLTHCGKRIPRLIRDGFTQLDTRKIISRVELVGDTGRVDSHFHEGNCEEDRGVYLSVSRNRGMSFSQRRYRTLGRSGQNDKIIEWLGLGSANSVLFEIGSSSLHKLQIYDVKIDVR